MIVLGANLHINILELKLVFLAIRSFQTHLLNKRVLVASDNATVVAYLNKQGGTHSLDNVSYDMASDGILQPQGNFAKGLTYPGLSECDSRQPLSQGQDYSNRMVSSSRDFSGDLPFLAQANGRYVESRYVESRWTIFESWCKENQVEFEKPPVSSIAHLFTYLFNEKS